ncbi:hypothetical protein DNTS_007693, partial [Danionella cerebrum]
RRSAPTVPNWTLQPLADTRCSHCQPHAASATRSREQAPRQRVLVLLEQGLGLPPGPVLVIRVLLHVHGAQPFRLVDEGSLFRLGHEFPLRSQALADLRIVHLRVLLSHFPTLTPRPHHEGVHGSLDAVLVNFAAAVGSRVSRVCVSLGSGRVQVRFHHHAIHSPDFDLLSSHTETFTRSRFLAGTRAPNKRGHSSRRSVHTHLFQGLRAQKPNNRLAFSPSHTFHNNNSKRPRSKARNILSSAFNINGSLKSLGITASFLMEEPIHGPSLQLMLFPQSIVYLRKHYKLTKSFKDAGNPNQFEIERESWSILDLNRQSSCSSTENSQASQGLMHSASTAAFNSVWKNNGQLDKNQSGFKNSHSTETSLLSVTEALRLSRANSESSVLCSLRHVSKTKLKYCR